jgi:hypothetical protein
MEREGEGSLDLDNRKAAPIHQQVYTISQTDDHALNIHRRENSKAALFHFRHLLSFASSFIST